MHEKQFDGAVERLRSPERVVRLEVERVADLCLESGGFKTVLDVGVGSGIFAEAFSRRGLVVAGVDINPQMVTAARQFVPQGDFREAPAEALPYPDGSFDLVFMGLLLHESDEPRKVLQEARRVTCRQVCILEWPYLEEEFGPPLAHRLKPADIAEMSRQAGFARLETVQLNHLVLYRLNTREI
ncbi:MAG: Methyltransferase type 11 [Chloroflexi bacterium]|nr:Methyltransferase type 11 [Chloroflexota bacterium]